MTLSVDAENPAQRFDPRDPGFLADPYPDDLVDAPGERDFVAAMAWPMPRRVNSDILGVGAADLDLVRGFTEAFLLLSTDMVHLPLEEQVEAARTYVRFQHYAADRIRERRADPRDDLLSALVDDDLGVGDQVMLVMHTLVAGHETTAGMLSHTVHLLLSAPERWARPCSAPELVPAAVEESLRLEASVQCHRRRAGSRATSVGSPCPRGRPRSCSTERRTVTRRSSRAPTTSTRPAATASVTRRSAWARTHASFARLPVRVPSPPIPGKG